MEERKGGRETAAGCEAKGDTWSEGKRSESGEERRQ